MRQPDAERQLIGRMQAGDGTAVTELASTYGPRIQQLALRYVKNWEDAEEVTQDVLDESASEDRCVPRRRGAVVVDLSDYVQHRDVTAAQRARGSHDRGSAVGQRSGEEPERMPAEPADWSSLADDQVLRGQMRERLIASLVHLPAVYRIPVILRDIQGLSTEEASAVLRVKPQTLKSRLHRGRLLLREQLADFAGGVMLHAREVN